MTLPTVLNKSNMQSLLAIGLFGLVAFGFVTDRISGEVVTGAFGAVIVYFYNRSSTSK